MRRGSEKPSQNLSDADVKRIDEALKEAYPNLVPFKTYGMFRICVHSGKGTFHVVNRAGEMIRGTSTNVDSAEMLCREARKKETKRQSLDLDVVVYAPDGVSFDRWKNKEDTLLVDCTMLGVSATDRSLRVLFAGKKEAVQQNECYILSVEKKEPVAKVREMVKALLIERQEAERLEKEIEKIVKKHGYCYNGGYGRMEPEQVAEVEAEIREGVVRGGGGNRE